MTCDFTSFAKELQSNQDDKGIIINAVCNGTLFTVEKISPQVGLESRTLYQLASAKPAELPDYPFIMV